MSHDGFSWRRTSRSLHRASLRAFDLSERTARRGWRSQRRRVGRWRSRLFMIVQISLAAGLSWWIAKTLLGHEAPFLATVASIVCLGFSFGQRLGRAAELAVGVTVGVFMGDVFVHTFGTGVWQIMLVVGLAISFTTWLGARTLMTTQAAVQAAVVMTVVPDVGAGVARWQDALIGCAVALIIATVAPVTPVDKPRLLVAKVLHEASATVRAMVEALRTEDFEAAEKILERARATEHELAMLLVASEEGMAVTRTSPFLRRHRRDAQQISDLLTPLDRFIRNLRVLARRVSVATFHGEVVPEEYRRLLRQFAQVIDECASELFARRLPTSKIDDLCVLGERTSRLPIYPKLSSTVILAQVRSMLVDLLELCGMEPTDARTAIPDMD